ncbi:MAG: 4Fe-4S dicluster domain-containing protein [Armatimonadetes bacterium ATM1]|nr:MAG: 4Fe-4S dicluster domain-containing protein [Armatimonadota bacterium]MBC6969640.1 4Fe-4S dicluster domain-containing protein [Armatimonadota bacterium]MCE7898909.1 4Fe-4S dicluster domain-containing protein [Armatimonadetes bacterium ATM1]RIJ97892.1 MAG: ferredoxin [Armatimonadota bacterium]
MAVGAREPTDMGPRGKPPRRGESTFLLQYGFVIDQEACIGCHACTVACKAENNVPVGSFRTFVKYVDVGSYPDVTRQFLVQRCNQCTSAPCVAICPVNALVKRPDGIVDVDREACIGCRACMQACPYDAIYLNEDLRAVEKCHFCAHRVERGLEPACAVVCPVRAIIPGDFDDPESEVSQLVRMKATRARREEQGTGPNVRYVGASELTLVPGIARRERSYMWSERPSSQVESPNTDRDVRPDATVSLDVEAKVEWGWPVALYLLTKSIAGGAALLAPFSSVLGVAPPRFFFEAIALAFTAITVFLLVEDLAKPMAFYRLFTRPNWNSWLVKGGVLLSVFGATTAAILVLDVFSPGGELVEPLRWVNALLGALVAGYTAFLFRQCKGRDLWEGPTVLPHLIVQAALCGAAICIPWTQGVGAAQFLFAICAGMHIALIVAENFLPHPTENGKQALGYLTSLPLLGVSARSLSIALAAAAAILAFLPLGALVAAAFATASLFAYEHAFVRAGQLPPLS